jgi:hypothetical protein
VLDIAVPLVRLFPDRLSHSKAVFRKIRAGICTI